MHKEETNRVLFTIKYGCFHWSRSVQLLVPST